MLRNFRRILLDNILVLLFAAAAIVLHAIIPSPGATMDTSKVNPFVKTLFLKK